MLHSRIYRALNIITVFVLVAFTSIYSRPLIGFVPVNSDNSGGNNDYWNRVAEGTDGSIQLQVTNTNGDDYYFQFQINVDYITNVSTIKRRTTSNQEQDEGRGSQGREQA